LFAKILIIHHWWWKIKLFDLLICVFCFCVLVSGMSSHAPPAQYLLNFEIIITMRCWCFFNDLTLSQPYELCSLLGHNIVFVFLIWIKKVKSYVNSPIPYFLLGDEAFPLKNYLMKPYVAKKLNRLPQEFNDEPAITRKIYNHRQARARRFVENGFEILATKWWTFRRPI